MDHRQIYQKENSLTDLLRRSFVCCQDEKRSECMYSRVFSTMRTDKRSSKKRSNYFHFGIYTEKHVAYSATLVSITDYIYRRASVFSTEDQSQILLWLKRAEVT